MRTTIGVGSPDFIIAIPGKVLFIECKDKKGKQTTEQIGFQMQLEGVGHAYNLVRSMEQFKKLVEEK
jgi:hypothetical protein